MKNSLIALGLMLALTSCNTMGSAEVEPIPGSITYGGQPRTKLTKSPVGSIVQHQFTTQQGFQVEESYVLQPDRSLKLTSRRYLQDTPSGRY